MRCPFTWRSKLEAVAVRLFVAQSDRNDAEAELHAIEDQVVLINDNLLAARRRADEALAWREEAEKKARGLGRQLVAAQEAIAEEIGHAAEDATRLYVLEQAISEFVAGPKPNTKGYAASFHIFAQRVA